MQHASREKKGKLKIMLDQTKKQQKRTKWYKKTEHKQETNVKNYNKSFKYSN